VNQGELSKCCFKHDDSTIKIVLVLLIIIIKRAKQINNFLQRYYCY